MKRFAHFSKLYFYYIDIQFINSKNILEAYAHDVMLTWNYLPAWSPFGWYPYPFQCPWVSAVFTDLITVSPLVSPQVYVTISLTQCQWNSTQWPLDERQRVCAIYVTSADRNTRYSTNIRTSRVNGWNGTTVLSVWYTWCSFVINTKEMKHNLW